jgi:hypothetical protein
MDTDEPPPEPAPKVPQLKKQPAPVASSASAADLGWRYGSDHVGKERGPGSEEGSEAASSGAETQHTNRSSTRHWRAKGPSATARHRKRNAAWEEKMRSRHPDWQSEGSVTGEQQRVTEAGLKEVKKESPMDFCHRTFSSFMPKYEEPYPELLKRCADKVEADAVKHKRCRICDKGYSKEHIQSSLHEAKLKELAALEEMLGERPDIREISQVARKPIVTTYGVPTLDRVLSHWGDMTMFVGVAMSRATARGVLYRPVKSRPLERIPSKSIRGLVPAIVKYSGQGMYKVDGPSPDFAIRCSDLPRSMGPGIVHGGSSGSSGSGEWQGPTPPPGEETGWWPVLAIDWSEDGTVVGQLSMPVPGGTLMLIWVVCVYQWQVGEPVAWRCWVFIPNW